ncbi:MAG: hypothetical protein BMS9Abin31_0860 [Gammaproteobacteria bacterium]|nr:MAG: hypothetical protein BMS9Abin31_0860 [Gammaproteobacteria bacterium]
MQDQLITSKLIIEDPGLIDLVDRFISRLPGMHDAITKAYDDNEWEVFVDLIHQMKGVGGNYGYSELTTLCSDIEVAAKEQNFEKVKSQLKEFKLLSESIVAGKDENRNIAKALS